jgi:hypothetical protein
MQKWIWLLFNSFLWPWLPIGWLPVAGSAGVAPG